MNNFPSTRVKKIIVRYARAVPLVYEGGESYLVVIQKLVCWLEELTSIVDDHTNKLNEVIDEVNQINTDIDSLRQEMIDFENAIRNGLPSQIEAEVSRQLAELIATGEISSELNNNYIYNTQNFSANLSNHYKEITAIRENRALERLLSTGAQTIRIAYVGDSITEVSSIAQRQNYTYKINDFFRQYFGTVEYQNFGLGSRSITNLVDPNYKAVNPETDYRVNFWRPWATVGKSWMECVTDYNPDIIFASFGMNERGGYASGDIFFYSAAAMQSQIRAALPNASIYFLTSALPSSTYIPGYAFDNVESTHNASKGLARLGINTINGGLLNYYIVNSDKLQMNAYQYRGNNPNGLNAYNFEGGIYTTDFPDVTTNMVFYFRRVVVPENAGWLGFLFYKSNGVNYINLIRNSNGATENLHSWTIGTATSAYVSVFENSIAVNGNAFEASYHGLFSNTSTYVQNGTNFTVFDMMCYNNRDVAFKMPESFILGQYRGSDYGGLGGNGFTHPSENGMELIYNGPVIAALQSVMTAMIR